MHDFDLIVSPYNGHMLRNLSKFYLFICCKQSSSTHFCHFLATTFVTDVLMGANPSVMGPKTKGPHSWEPVKSVVGDEGCPRAASPPASASGLRPSRAALENACAFPQLRTLAGSNPSACPQEKPPDRLCAREAGFFGWDGGIRTPNSRHQKPEFYR